MSGVRAGRAPRAVVWTLWSLAGALVANLIIFAGAPFLLRLVGDHGTGGPPIGQMVVLSPPPPAVDDPLPEEEPPPPPKPEPPSAEPLDTSSIIPRLEAPPLELSAKLSPSSVAIPTPTGDLGYGALGRPDQMPMPISQTHPPYPYLARRRGVQGWVQVRLLVNNAGDVDKLLVIKSNPTGVFEDTVRRTVLTWRFKPAVKDGHPVAAWVQTTIRFRLER